MQGLDAHPGLPGHAQHGCMHRTQEEREWEDEAEAARRAAAESAEAKRVDKMEVDVSAEVAAAIEDDEMGLGARPGWPLHSLTTPDQACSLPGLLRLRRKRALYLAPSLGSCMRRAPATCAGLQGKLCALTLWLACARPRRPEGAQAQEARAAGALAAGGLCGAGRRHRDGDTPWQQPPPGRAWAPPQRRPAPHLRPDRAPVRAYTPS